MNEAVSTEEMQDEEITDQQIEAEFEAGFTGTPAEKVEAPANLAEEQTDEVVEPKPIVETTPKIAGLDDAQVKELLAKASRVEKLEAELGTTRDTLNGRLGQVLRDLKELQKQKAETKPVKAKFENLRKDYEDIADLLEQDLAAQNADPVDVDSKIASGLDALRNEYDAKLDTQVALKVMNMIRPDWVEVKDSPDFATFKTTMSPEDVNVYDTTTEPHELNSIFKKFDAWKESQTKGEAEKAEVLQKKEANKKQRLASAIQPRGNQPPAATMSDDDYFVQGFQSVRSGRL